MAGLIWLSPLKKKTIFGRWSESFQALITIVIMLPCEKLDRRSQKSLTRKRVYD
jgi:hypothetical protein